MRTPRLHAGPLLAWMALCAVPAARAVEPLPNLAPLALRTQGTLRELFLDQVGSDARASGLIALDLRYAIANDWGIPTTLTQKEQSVTQLLDEQADSLTAAASVPWSRLFGAGPTVFAGRPLWERLSTTFEARATLHWGGWTDAPIETWHEISGAFNFQRADYPRNQVGLYLGSPGGSAIFDIHSARLALNDLVARTQLTLFEGGYSAGALTAEGELRPAWAVALRLDIKAPVGLLNRAGGSGGWDGGAALLFTAELTHWLAVHALAGASAFSNWSSDLALRPKPWHATAELSLAATFAGWAFLLEDRVVSPLLMPGWERVEFGGNDGLLASTLFGSFRSHNQVSWGLRRGGLSVWLSEDFTPGSNPRSNLKWLYNSNAPDVVIGVAYAREL